LKPCEKRYRKVGGDRQVPYLKKTDGKSSGEVTDGLSGKKTSFLQEKGLKKAQENDRGG